MINLYDFDTAFLSQCDAQYLLGIDEAGRGPLAGPVVTAATVLRLEDIVQGINDSKKLSEKKRKLLFKEIYSKAIYKKVIAVSEKEIERINIRKATIVGMEACVSGWDKIEDSYVIIDGDLILSSIPLEKQKAIVKGDATSASIAAASILAKVSRDQLMVRYSKQYPEYNFNKHKGYGTKDHIEAIKKFGLSPIHRKSFCKKFV